MVNRGKRTDIPVHGYVLVCSLGSKPQTRRGGEGTAIGTPEITPEFQSEGMSAMQRVRLRAAVRTRGKGALVCPSNGNSGGPPTNVFFWGRQPQYEIVIIIYDHNNNNFDWKTSVTRFQQCCWRMRKSFFIFSRAHTHTRTVSVWFFHCPTPLTPSSYHP